jgi:hypothetical protein
VSNAKPLTDVGRSDVTELGRQPYIFKTDAISRAPAQEVLQLTVKKIAWKEGQAKAHAGAVSGCETEPPKAAGRSDR